MDAPALDMTHVENLVKAFYGAVSDSDATMLEAYVASRAINETYFDAIAKGSKDREQLRRLLDGR